MEIYYHIRYDNASTIRNSLKIIVLLVAVIFDFLAIYSIIRIIVEGAIFWIMLIGYEAIATILRIIALSLIKQYDYKYQNGEFSVVCSSNLIKITKLKLNNSLDFDIAIVDKISTGGNKIMFLYSKKRNNNSSGRYINVNISIKTMQYNLLLDEYLFAILEEMSSIKKHEVI